MNMVFLTGLSVALALSIMTTDNFYAEKVANASINQFNAQSSDYAKNVVKDTINRYSNNNPINFMCKRFGIGC